MKYNYSKDYELLYKEVCDGLEALCLVDNDILNDRSKIMRDVCRIRRFKEYDIQIGVRGYGYGYGAVDSYESHTGTEKELFIQQCISLNLEWIPVVRPLYEYRRTETLFGSNVHGVTDPNKLSMHQLGLKAISDVTFFLFKLNITPSKVFVNFGENDCKILVSIDQVNYLTDEFNGFYGFMSDIQTRYFDLGLNLEVGSVCDVDQLDMELIQSEYSIGVDYKNDCKLY